MSKKDIAFVVILVFLLGLVLGAVFVSVSLSSNTNYKPHIIKINDFVNIKIYTNSIYESYKINKFVRDLEDFTYTDENMIVLSEMICERFNSVVNVRYLKSDGTYFDYKD